MSKGQKQLRNVENVRLLSSNLQPRYEPNFAWKSAASLLVNSTGCRFAWGGGVGTSGEMLDLSGLGNHLSLNGSPTLNYDGLVPLFDYGGGSYHSITDAASGNAFDIVGTESYINANGLSIAAWMNADRSGSVEHIIGKWGASGNRSYRLVSNAADKITAQISVDGTAITFVSSTGSIPIDGTWVFVALEFIPSTSITVWLNDESDTNVASIPASIFNSSVDFSIGATGTGGNGFDGEISWNAVYPVALGSTVIQSIFEQTRAAYGV